MPMHSQVVKHKDRAAIERGLATGVPVRQLAKKHGLSIDTLYRYKAQIPPQLKAAHLGAKLRAGVDLEKLRIDESEGLLQNLAQQRARLLMCQDGALEIGDRREATFIAGEIHRNLKLVGQYLGEFAQHQVQTHVSVLIMPQYLEMRAELLKALNPFPAARKAVAAALQSMEAKAAAPEPKTLPPMIDGVATEVSASA
jgi:hypothetical protein